MSGMLDRFYPDAQRFPRLAAIGFCIVLKSQQPYFCNEACITCCNGEALQMFPLAAVASDMWLAMVARFAPRGMRLRFFVGLGCRVQLTADSPEPRSAATMAY